MLFIEFEPLCQTLWAFLSKFVSFYDARSLNMVMSHDRRCKFRKFLFCPNSTFIIRKSHKICSGKAIYFRSYQQNSHEGGGKLSRGGWKTPPTLVPFKVKSEGRNLRGILMVVRVKLEEKQRQKFNRIKNLYATDKKFRGQLPKFTLHL